MRYTFFDALPLNQSSAALVTAALEARYPRPVSELAKDAGISRYAAMRAADQLRNLGILVSKDDGRTWLFNDDHPLTSTLIDLAWKFSGTISADRTRDTPRYRHAGDRRRDSLYRHQRTVPPWMLDNRADPTSDTAGPDLTAVRDLVGWARTQRRRLALFEETGQSVYSSWRTERLRDVVHQTMDFGSALSTLIDDAKRVPAQGVNAPSEVHVSSTWWAAATYLVSAEAYDAIRVLAIFSTAIREGARFHGAWTRELELLRRAARTDDATDREELLAKSIAEDERAEAIWRDLDVRPLYHHLGGMPSPRDVGRAGDQILSVQLRACAVTLSEKVAKMAAHPGFLAWAAENPEEAEAFPLAPLVPESEPREAQ